MRWTTASYTQTNQKGTTYTVSCSVLERERDIGCKDVCRPSSIMELKGVLLEILKLENVAVRNLEKQSPNNREH